MTPVLRTTRGYQIIKLETSRTRRSRRSTRRAPRLPTRSPTSKRQGEIEKFIAKLRAQAIIDWKNDEIKKAYEVGLKQEEAETPQQ